MARFPTAPHSVNLAADTADEVAAKLQAIAGAGGPAAEMAAVSSVLARAVETLALRAERQAEQITRLLAAVPSAAQGE
ncbi:MAG: hypothetical protein GY719_25690 [bacterium]|nr:hypothetical protein [bacterium]